MSISSLFDYFFLVFYSGIVVNVCSSFDFLCSISPELILSAILELFKLITGWKGATKTLWNLSSNIFFISFFCYNFLLVWYRCSWTVISLNRESFVLSCRFFYIGFYLIFRLIWELLLLLIIILCESGLFSVGNLLFDWFFLTLRSSVVE